MWRLVSWSEPKVRCPPCSKDIPKPTSRPAASRLRRVAAAGQQQASSVPFNSSPTSLFPQSNTELQMADQRYAERTGELKEGVPQPPEQARTPWPTRWMDASAAPPPVKPLCAFLTGAETYPLHT